MRLVEEEEIEEMERLEESKEVEVELLHQDSRWESSKTSNRREKNTTSLAGKYGRVQNKDRKHRAPKILKYGLLVGWGDEDRGAKKLSLETTSKLLEEDQGSRLLGEQIERVNLEPCAKSISLEHTPPILGECPDKERRSLLL